jgi:CheY-like chemotaxis protein
VSDTGIGINEEGRSKLFQAFSQVDSSNTRQYGGTGLGLVISDRLVQLMGGQIELVSTPGEGSEFFFTIRAETVRQTTSVPDSENGPREAILRYPPGVKILIAEDVEVNMTVVKEMLVRLLPEPELILARNGQEAIDLYREQQPDLILMDIQMPVLDGNLASEQIRRLEREQSMPRTPIVGLTARSMPHEIEAAMTHGMDQCLTKPVPLRSLGGVLEQYLQVNDS